MFSKVRPMHRLVLLLAGLVAALSIEPALASSVSAAPASLSFGQVSVGQVSATQTVSFSFSSATSVGSVSVLTFGAAEKDFQPTTGTTCVAGSFGAGATCAVAVGFSPLLPGNRNGAVVLRDGSSPANVIGLAYLTGIGTAPVASFFPGPLAPVAGTLSSTGLTNVGFGGDGGPATASSALLQTPGGLVIDGAGNLFFTDSGNNRVREVNAQTRIITTVAGGGNGCAQQTNSLGDGCPATSAILNDPHGIAVDGAGNLFVADVADAVLRRVDASTGVITTVAGNRTAGFAGDGGPATKAELANPWGVAVDGVGNLYISDPDNSRIRLVTAATGKITTFAGTGAFGWTGDGGPAVSAELAAPEGMKLDAAGNLFVADPANYTVRAINLASGVIRTIAGDGNDNNPALPYTPTLTSLLGPTDVAVDAGGTVYIADAGAILYTGNLNSASGTQTLLFLLNTPIVAPISTLAVDPLGNFYSGSGGLVASYGVTGPQSFAFGSVQAGNNPHTGAQSFELLNTGNATIDFSYLPPPAFSVNVNCENAALKAAAGDNCSVVVNFDPPGVGPYQSKLTFTDNSLNQSGVQQEIALSGTGTGLNPTTTVLQASASLIQAGSPLVLTATVTPGSNQTKPAGTVTFFNGPTSIGTGTLSSAGAATLTVTTLPVGSDSLTAAYGGDANDQPSTSPVVPITITSAVSKPPNPPSLGTVAVGQKETVPVTFQFAAATTLGSVSVLTNASPNLDYTAGPGTTCVPGTFNAGASCTVNLVFAPRVPGVRPGVIVLYDKSTPAEPVAAVYLNGVGSGPQVIFSPAALTALGGNGQGGFGGDGGPFAQASLNAPNDMVVDGAGDIYIADTVNNRVRRIDGATGIITTIAGDGKFAETGDGGPAVSAELESPEALALDRAGILYVSDYNGSYNSGTPILSTAHLRRIDLNTGLITSVQVNGAPVVPLLAAVDNAGNLYVAPASYNYAVEGYTEQVERIDQITETAVVVAGNGTGGETGDGGLATAAEIDTYTLVFDTANNLYINGLDANGNPTIREVNASTGIINTVIGGSGTGCAQQSDILGDGCTASQATLSPSRIAFDSLNNIYVDDFSLADLTSTSNNPLVRRIDAQSGIVTLVAGELGDGNNGVLLPNGLATAVDLSSLSTLRLDALGNLYLLDSGDYYTSVLFGDGTLNSWDLYRISPYTPPTISLGDSLVGVTTLPFQVRSTNAGNATLDISSVVPSSLSFPLSTTSTCTPGTTLGQGGNCILGLEFAPQAAGPATATVTLTDNSLNQTAAQQTIALSGIGLAQQAPTNTALTVSSSAITLGNSVTLTATVSASSGTPTGTVYFETGATILGSASLNAGGVAILTTAALPLGNDSVVAVYNGAAPLAASASQPVAITVSTTTTGSFTTTIALTASLPVASPGQAVTFAAQVVPAAGQAAPTGTVTFLDGTTQLGAGSIASTGVATLTTISLSSGTHSVTASYGGDAANKPAVSAAVQVSVTAATPKLLTAATAASAPVNFGSADVGQTGSPVAIAFTFSTGIQLSSVAAVTQGSATGEFRIQSTGTNCAAGTFASGTTCTVNLAFAPVAPGLRRGAVVLYDNSSPARAVATAFVYGQGVAPQFAFTPGIIRTIAGHSGPVSSGNNGPASLASIANGNSVMDGAGNLYFFDFTSFNGGSVNGAGTGGGVVLRKIDAASGIIHTIGGNGSGCPQQNDVYGDGCLATQASFYDPYGLGMDGAGNLYFVDGSFNDPYIPQITPFLRRIDAATQLVTEVSVPTAPGYYSANVIDGAGTIYLLDNPSTSANQIYPTTLLGFDPVAGTLKTLSTITDSLELNYLIGGGAVDGLGHYFGATSLLDQTVFRVDLASGNISQTLPAACDQFGFDTGPQVALDASGTLYYDTEDGGAICQVTPSNGASVLIAGGNTYSAAALADGIPATQASFQDLSVDDVTPEGTIYLTDGENSSDGTYYDLLRKIDVSNTGALNFGAIAIGSSSAAQNVTVENIGNAPLTLQQINPGPNFSIGGPGTTCQSFGQVLLPQQSCILGVVFKPLTSGNLTTRIEIVSNSGNQTTVNQIPVSGIATGGTQAATTTTLKVTPTSVTQGMPVTLTATVAEKNGSAIPTGTVTFLAGTTTLGTATLNGNGAATFNTSTLAVGSYSMTASYNSDSANAPSVSAPVALTVLAQVPTTTKLTATAGQIQPGEQITFTATVAESGGSATPTGTVTFYANSASIGSGTLNTNGVTTFTTSSLPTGLLPIVATYGGDAINAGSTSAPLVVSVCSTCGNWVWVGGPQIVLGNQNPIYGTEGTASTSNSPGEREGSATWTDSKGNLWLFGGTGGYGFMADLWMLDPGKGAWAWEGGPNSQTNAAGQTGTWGTMGQGSTGNLPGGREFSAFWLDKSGNFWLFGGVGFDSNQAVGTLNDLWKYVPSSGVWTWVGGNSTYGASGSYGAEGTPGVNNYPGARSGAFNWTDEKGNFWLFGGYGYGGSGTYGPLNDLWEYDVSSAQWTWVSGSKSANGSGVYGQLGKAVAGNIPGARSNGAAWIDPQGNLWLFGGEGNDSKGSLGYLNDLWEYVPSTNLWTWVSGSDTANQPGVFGAQGTANSSNVPGARDDVSSWIDNQGELWLFGGNGFDSTGTQSYLADTWMFTPSTGFWTFQGGSPTGNSLGSYGTQGVPAPGNSPPSRFTQLSWSDSAGNLWMYGGGSNGGIVFTDIWEYLLAAPGAAGPVAELSPPAYTFASLTAGTTSGAEPFTLSNIGKATLNISSIAIGGKSPANYALGTGANACGTTLAAGAQCSIYVTFTPSAAAGYQATLTVTDNAPGSPQTAALSGTGLVVAAPQASLTPSLAFPSTMTGTASAAMAATLSNTGNASLNISSIAIGGVNPADFAIGTGANACGTILAAGGQCSIYVTFTPSSATSFTATLMVTDNANGSPQTSSLTGTGTVATPVAALAPASFNFQRVTEKTTSLPALFTLTNTGTAALKNIAVSITGTNPGDFTIESGTNACGATLAAGKHCNIQVTFTPSSVASLSAVLSITDNASGSPQTASLSGAGTASPAPVAALTPGTLTFTTALGTTSSAQTVTLSNTGNAALNIGSIALGGSDPGDFAITTGTNACGPVVSASSTCSIYITFTPASATSSSATLTVTDNATPSTQSTTLVGTGTLTHAPVAVLTPALAFPNTNAGTTSSALVAKLANSGNATLNISAIMIGGTNPSDFAVSTGTNACGTTLAAGANCSIYVTFTPSSAAGFSATLTVTDNATPKTQSTTLTGTGTTPPAPVASLTPGTLTFTAVSGTTSAAQAATLSNTGNATLNIAGIALGGTNPSDFAITTGANACGATLAANATCSIYLTFTPASATTFSATLTVTDNATPATQSAMVTGTGTPPPAPVASLAPGTLTFTAVSGATSAAQTATLSNTGNAPLTISGITIAGANPSDFAETSTCGESLAAGSKCNINVTFTPDSAASFSATLQVADNASGSPQSTTLSGTGTPPPSFSVTSTSGAQTIQPGGAAAYTITVSAQNGSFSNAVSLSASGLPVGATATFTPPSVTPGSASATSTLSVQTGTTTASARPGSAWPLTGPALAILSLLFLPGKRRRRCITLALLLIASLGAFTALTACGGGFSLSQPPQNYTITVTGTSGSDVQTTTVQLTVQ